jgi:uncharacterized protein (DUF305 family)
MDMKNKETVMTYLTTRRTVAAALVAGAVYPIARVTSAQQGGHGAHHGESTPMGMQGMGMMQMGDVDLMFIDMMTPHHASAIAMAEVALERAEHPELAELAEAIIASQQTEIDQMQAWRDEWYPGEPEMPMGEMGGMGDMMQCPQNMQGMGMMDMTGMMDPEAAAEEIRAAPEPFDLAFINSMIPHHLMALMMTEGLIQTAQHPELAELAQGMFDEQLDEITTMQRWRTEWYGADASATPSS